MLTRTSGAGMHEPVHPGKILSEVYLDPLKVSVTDAAEALGVSRKHVSALVNGRASVNPDMAIRLGLALQTDPAFWLNMQSQFDLWTERQKPAPKVKPLKVA
jgi:addiction module HigA family antidote